jgi:hypothetical protein
MLDRREFITALAVGAIAPALPRAPRDLVFGLRAPLEYSFAQTKEIYAANALAAFAATEQIYGLNA